MRAKWVAAVVALGLSAGAGAAVLAPPAADEALDPIKAAPDTHRVAFENAVVRVLDVRLPPGSVEPRHRHPHGLSVYFTDWEARVTPDGQPPQVRSRKAGTFAWSEAIVHTVENVGRTEGHILRIELKR
jgi:quercetin dioxygenase-like cupin family protein